MNLNYIKYLWSKTNKFVIAGLVILSSIFLIQIMIQAPSTGNGTVSSYLPYDLQLFILMIMVVSSSAILPIIVRKQMLSKQNCDTLLSLPLKRTILFTLTSLYTYLIILSIFTIMFVLGLITYFCMGMNIIVGYLLLYYLTVVITSLSIFIIMSAIMSFANNILDCILLFVLTVIISLTFPSMLDYVLRLFNVTYGYHSNGIVFSLDYISHFFATKALVITPGFSLGRPDYTIFRYELTHEYIDVLICFVLSILSLFVFYKNIKSFKSYNVGERSNELIFKIFIPLVFFLFLIFFGIGYEFMTIFILSICYFVGWFIIYRKIKFTKYQIITYVITLLLVIVLSNI
ncbi:MAG: hypothetical protein R3Y05_06385 [bacterium]